MSLTRPKIICEMKVREVYAYSEEPLYEVLLFKAGFKNWRALRRSNGEQALFSHPPLSEQEARDIIKEHEEKAVVEEPI